MKRIAVFASGSGSNFQSISDSITSGRTSHITLCGLVASKPDIQALARAQHLQIPAVIISKSSFSSEEAFSMALLNQVTEWKTDIIALAGYLTKLPSTFTEMFKGPVVNIHPSLLPKFGGHGYYGLNVHQAVIEAGETETGCTVHMVDAEYDTGRILAQKKVSVIQGESASELAARVLKLEHELYPEILEQVACNLM